VKRPGENLRVSVGEKTPEEIGHVKSWGPLAGKKFKTGPSLRGQKIRAGNGAEKTRVAGQVRRGRGPRVSFVDCGEKAGVDDQEAR